MGPVYIQDESKYEGSADKVFAPETISQLSEVVKSCGIKKEKITIQGGLTGIVGGAIPMGGNGLSTKRLNRIEYNLENGIPYVYAEAGVTADELERVVRKESNNTMFFPVLPTEKTATLGGIVATGAGSILSYGYGELRNYVQSLTVCTSQGDIKTFTEEMTEFDDWFRSEGMLGILVSFRLKLVKKPIHMWGVFFQLDSVKKACEFAEKVENMPGIIVLEYMDRRTIEVIEIYKTSMNTISGLPDMESDTEAIVYVEVTGNTEEEAVERAEMLLQACIESDGNPDNAWAMCTEEDIERLRAYRHAASECVNMEIAEANTKDYRIYKMSMDARFKSENRREILESYYRDIDGTGIRYCIFGHFGVLGLCVNLIPCDYEQYEEGKQIMEHWTREAYEKNGEVFTEHGVGKLKKEFFLKDAPVEAVCHAIRKKEKWDKEGMFNPGNMF